MDDDLTNLSALVYTLQFFTTKLLAYTLMTDSFKVFPVGEATLWNALEDIAS
jgi:hypothetical protein